MKKYLHLLSAVLILSLLTLSICVRADKHAGNVFLTNGPPQIIVGDVSGVIAACEGTASVSPFVQQFSFSASGLSADVTVTAPNYFEISRAAGGPYVNNLTIPQISGLVSSVTIYIRSSAQALPGFIHDQVQLVSGIVSQNALVTGHINPLPVIDPVADQTRQNGQLTDPIVFSGVTGLCNWTNDNPSIGLPASGSGNIDKFKVINTGAIPVTAHITVTPPPPASYLYASNSALNSVLLVNTTSRKVEHTITDGIPPNSAPLQMVFSPDKSLLYVANQSSKTISVINTTTNKVIASFPGGPEPTGIVISPDGSKLYVTDPSFNHLTIINTSAPYAITKNIATGAGTYDLAISADGKKLYLLNTIAGAVQFYDIATNIFEYGLAITGTPGDIIVSPDGKTLYISTITSHDIAVVDIASRRVTYRIDVVYETFNMAISPGGEKLYVTHPIDNKVSVVDIPNRKVVANIDVGANPAGIAINTDGSKIYVVNEQSTNIAIIDAATNKLAGEIQTEKYGIYLAILSDNVCNGQPITFSITVNPSATIPPIDSSDPVVIPNTFSPNGDGTNDTWVIKNLNAYPQNTVEVFNRYGQKLFRSIGYSVPWDGTFKGSRVPPGTYYYIVNLKNGSRQLSGNVTVIR